MLKPSKKPYIFHTSWQNSSSLHYSQGPWLSGSLKIHAYTCTKLSWPVVITELISLSHQQIRAFLKPAVGSRKAHAAAANAAFPDSFTGTAGTDPTAKDKINPIWKNNDTKHRRRFMFFVIIPTFYFTNYYPYYVIQHLSEKQRNIFF